MTWIKTIQIPVHEHECSEEKNMNAICNCSPRHLKCLARPSGLKCQARPFWDQLCHLSASPRLPPKSNPTCTRCQPDEQNRVQVLGEQTSMCKINCNLKHPKFHLCASWPHGGRQHWVFWFHWTTLSPLPCVSPNKVPRTATRTANTILGCMLPPAESLSRGLDFKAAWSRYR